MNRTLAILISSVLAGSLAATLAVSIGCDDKPGPPWQGLRPVKQLELLPDDAVEYDMVIMMEQSRAHYDTRLVDLHAYYLNADEIDKIRWAMRELTNLREAKVFEWIGAKIPLVEDDPAPPDAPEALLVERVVSARENYLKDAEALGHYYERTNQALKARVIRNMQARLDPIRTYKYLDSAEYPPLDLQPRDIIEDANAMFDRALRLHEDGKGFMRMALTTNYDKQREALRLFEQMIREYPTSTRIALAAYYVGEIYKEYFDEDVRAVNWYERAYTWLPTIYAPARFQAAVVYDLRLNDKLKAIELYREVIDVEHYDSSNVDFARDRIEEIRDEAARQESELIQMGLEP